MPLVVASATDTHAVAAGCPLRVISVVFAVSDPLHWRKTVETGQLRKWRAKARSLPRAGYTIIREGRRKRAFHLRARKAPVRNQLQKSAGRIGMPDAIPTRGPRLPLL